MKRNYIFTVALLLMQLGFSQTEDTLDLRTSYTQYHNFNKGSLFLHLNKTSFLKDEDIWFTAYLYDTKTGQPFKETTNLYVGLYNTDGQLLTKKLFYMKNGIASGRLKIPSDNSSSLLYFKGYTEAMKSAADNHGFIEKIKILSNFNTKENEDETYSINLLAEGGHLLKGAENTVGFKVIDRLGKGTAISNGRLIDGDGKLVVSNISTNKLGIGKFRFYYDENQTYAFHIKFLDGSQLSETLSKARNKGIVLSVNNLLPGKLVVGVNTNSLTMSDLKNEDFYLAIHRDGFLALNNFTLDQKQKVLSFDKAKLWPGTNIITLFNKNLKPVAERLIFNNNGLKLGKLKSDIAIAEKKTDSIKMSLELYSKKNSPAIISLSVLPEETSSNNPSESIISSLLLRPYIKSHVENAPYYFKNMNRQKGFELDNLLLVQGWSKYDWSNIFSCSKQEVFSTKEGILLKGTVKNADKNKRKIFLRDILSDYQKVVELDSSNTFEITDGIIFKNSPLELMLFNTKGEPSKPDVDLNVYPDIKIDTLKIDKAFTYSDNSNDNTSLTTLENENLISLENVTVSAKAKKKYTVLPSGATGLKITDEKGTLSGFMRSQGFRVEITEAGARYAFFKRGPNAFPVFVSVDGYGDSIFFDMSLKQVDQIYYGKNDEYGFVSVIRKNNYSLKTFANIILKEGFEKPIEYYNPEYTSYNSLAYLNYGMVHWEPSLSVGTDGKADFTIPEYGLNGVKIYFEGMADDGTLYSDIKTVRLN